MVNKEMFIEYCEVHNNLYGTTKTQIKDIQDKQKIPLLDIDVQGALKFDKVFPDSNFIAILPPSIAELKIRL
jgi:guanylate kinase